MAQEEYTKYEFCKSIGCSGLTKVEGTIADYECRNYSYNCKQTAKSFHHWLKEQGYKLVKENSLVEVNPHDFDEFFKKIAECAD